MDDNVSAMDLLAMMSAASDVETKQFFRTLIFETLQARQALKMGASAERLEVQASAERMQVQASAERMQVQASKERMQTSKQESEEFIMRRLSELEGEALTAYINFQKIKYGPTNKPGMFRMYLCDIKKNVCYHVVVIADIVQLKKSAINSNRGFCRIIFLLH